MQLGDFFASAATAHPSNPRPVTFRAVARGKFLPGGTPNHHHGAVIADVTACFELVTGTAYTEARVEARKSLRQRFAGDDGISVSTDEADLGLEMIYQVLWRVLREWDAQERRAGEKLFPGVENVREMLEPDEAARVYSEYKRYVSEEHPEVVSDDTFRGAEAAGKRAP